MSCKIYSRVFSTFFLSAITTIVILTSFAIADEVKTQTDRFKIFKQAYIVSAFKNGNKLLVKFETRSAIKVSYKCTAQIRLKCVIFSGTFTDVFKDAIHGVKRLKIEFDIQNPQFEVIASDFSSLEGSMVEGAGSLAGAEFGAAMAGVAVTRLPIPNPVVKGIAT